MKKSLQKNLIKKIDLFEDIKMLQVNFMIYIIHKIWILLKITRIIWKIVFSNAFSRSMIDFYFFFKKNIVFFTTCNGETFKASKR